jgi:hypothetical protein
VTPWDARAMGRSAALTCAILLLAVVLTAASDEGGVSWGERVARVVPLVPVCAALATGLALAGRDRRGEGRALEALGRTPFANGSAAALGAAAVGLLAAFAVLLDRELLVTPFFPTVHATGSYTYDAGVFTNVREGWRVMSDGSIALPSDADAEALAALVGDPSGLPLHARGCAALLTLLGSAAFALTVAVTPRGAAGPRWGPSVVALLATAAASAVCLQAAAAGRVPLAVVPVPSTLLLLAAVWGIVRSQWQAQAQQATNPTT